MSAARLGLIHFQHQLFIEQSKVNPFYYNKSLRTPSTFQLRSSTSPHNVPTSLHTIRHYHLSTINESLKQLSQSTPGGRNYRCALTINTSSGHLQSRCGHPPILQQPCLTPISDVWPCQALVTIYCLPKVSLPVRLALEAQTPTLHHQPATMVETATQVILVITATEMAQLRLPTLEVMAQLQAQHHRPRLKLKLSRPKPGRLRLLSSSPQHRRSRVVWSDIPPWDCR